MLTLFILLFSVTAYAVNLFLIILIYFVTMYALILIINFSFCDTITVSIKLSNIFFILLA
jgi:hypothetical protein